MFRAAVVSVGKSVFRPRGFATYKTSTGLVGLAVDQNGAQTLQSLSQQALEAVKKIPADAEYRVDVEKWFKFISKTIEEKGDIKSIEDEISLGQIEEVIEMAKDELTLIDYYHENRVWELVEKEKKNNDEIVKLMADSIYFSSPEARGAAVPSS